MMGTPVQDEAARVANTQPEGLQDSDARLNQSTMTDEDRANLKTLQEKQNEEFRKASEPSETNFTHYLHLSDGRVVRSLSAAGTVYSEGKGTQDDPEKFTRVVGA